MMEKKYSTLPDVLRNVANDSGRGIHFVESNEKEVFYSYQEIYSKSLQVAGFLQSRGLKHGDELVFQLRDNKDFIVVFWACLLTGIIPVPLALGVNEEQKLKVGNVWSILNNPYLISSAEDAAKIKLSLPGEKLLLTEDMYAGNVTVIVHEPSENDIAFVQFSSGSTGAPKGVVLTHKNLLTNIDAIHQGIHSPDQGDLFFSWMPLTHDMGLIGFHLTPMFKGWTHHIMPTELFIRNPGLWFRKVTEHTITFTASPNFGYRYFLRHFKPGSYELDLSSLRVIVNGAEPISYDLCREFTNAMSEYGLKPNVIFPVYGLAEASLAVAFSDVNEEVIAFNANRKNLGMGQQVMSAANETEAVGMVEVGTAIDNCAIRIADDNDNTVGDGVVGNILIKGGNVTGGYYNNEKASRDAITADGWLRTGDLGFERDGRLYVTGRSKDIIFINGQNFYSHDVERCAEQVAGVELGKIVAAGFFDETGQKEKVVLFLLHKGDLKNFIPLIYALKKHLNLVFGFEVDEVIPVKEIKKTTSGKLQRYLFAESYKNGQYAEIQLEINELINAERKTAFNKPSTDVEQKLGEIWKQVLGHENFGIDEKFFEVGGNSLKAAEMAAWVDREWGVELTYESIFGKQTIALLAKEITHLPQSGKKPLTKASAKTLYPVSDAQRRLYYTWEMDRNAIGYNNPQALKIIGEVDVTRLETALSKLIVRHDILRTCFAVSGDNLWQVIKEGINCTVQYEQVDQQNIDSYLKNLVRPFDLQQAPLFRVALVKAADKTSYLFLDFHHIIVDGLSIYLFVDELFRLYNGEELPPLAWQYKDYVEWHADARDKHEIATHEKFWTNHIGEEPPLLNLPTASRPPLLTYNGAKKHIGIEPGIVARLKRFAKENNLSLYMLVLGIYNILLSKLSSKEDIIVGVPVAARHRPEFERMMGMFVNNIALRSYPSAGKTFMQFMQEVRQTCFETLRHQEYDFGRVIEQTGRLRDVSRNPVFDTMLLFQNMGFPVIDCAGLSVSRYFFDPGFSKYDISLEVFDEESCTDFYIEYNTDLFNADAIGRFEEHFKTLISNILKDPQDTIGNLSILSTEELSKYIVEYNNTAFEYPACKSIIDLFESTVTRNPGAIAVQHEGLELTYAELQTQAESLAGILADRGIGNGDIVAVMMERSLELVTAILAILKTGAAFLPIDHELPEERINFLVADSNAKLIVTKKAYGRKFTERDRLLVVDSLNLACIPIAFPATQTGDNLAYVIYTSGTTGKPKGVMVGQQALINYSCWAVDTYFRSEQVRIPLYTSISFDLTITSIFPPLISGNTIVIYNDDENYLAIEKILRDDMVEVMKVTPSHLKMLKSDAVFFSNYQHALKKFIVGGEDLSTQLANEIHAKFNGEIEIYNEYGPTEATVGCMIYKYNPEQQEVRSVPIGVPIHNAAIYVLDNCYKPVPVGVEGDMYIGGRCVARGYLFRDELTSQKFIANPFRPGEKMYCTGDRATRLADGNLAFAGRVDSQVKINGHRIELAEIESQLKKHADIEDVVVIARADEQNEKYLCAYVIGGRDKFINTLQLREYLQEELPAYMVPTYFVVVDTIPLTKNGKVDLPSLPLPNRVSQNTNDQPVTGIEKILIDIWKEVLNMEEIGTRDNFFHFGGDSIKAMQIVSRLQQAGYHTGIREVLRCQDIAQLAAHVSRNDTPLYEQGSVYGAFAPTPIVNWFLDQQFRNPHHFNQSVLLRFKNAIDGDVMEETLREIIGRHDGLRLNYDGTNGLLFYNDKHLGNKFRIEVEYAESITDTCTRLKSSFNIENDLLIRAAIIYTSNENFLFITAHHLVIDGVSWRILLDDVYDIYNSLKAGAIPVRTQKTASLIDWQKSIDKLGNDTTMSFEKQHWDAVCKDMVQEEHAGTARDMDSLQLTLCENVSHMFQDESFKNHGLSIEIILLTALLKSYHNVYEQDKMVIEMEHHGRSFEGIDLSRTIGWFTTLFPAAFVLSGQTVEEQLAAVRDQLHGIRNHGIGYGLTHHYINKIEPSPAQIRFNYLGQFDLSRFSDLFELSDLPTGQEVSADNHLTAGIEILCMVRENKLVSTVNYDPTTENAGVVRSLVSAFKENVATIFSKLENRDNIPFTPLEFETAGLNQDELNSLFD